MAVSARVADKAIKRWNLEGRVRVVPCGCRHWVWVIDSDDRAKEHARSRQVFHCEAHRYRRSI